MRSNCTITVFIKAPVPGFVKTRLVPPLSPELACSFYRAMALDTVSVARQLDHRAQVQIAYAPHPALPDIDWLDGSLRWFIQEGSDLGFRLRHAARLAAEQGPAVFIGSDMPALSPALLEEAFAALQDSSVVLGPAQDGGYYLIGMDRSYPGVFEGIAWSGPHVLKDTEHNLLRDGIAYRRLGAQTDIDTAQELHWLQTNPQALSPNFTRTRRALDQLRDAMEVRT